MNQRTIKKVLDELSKPTPDLSYIRGLLEGLVDEEEPEQKILNSYMKTGHSPDFDTDGISKAKSRVDEIKEIAKQSITNA